jgi:ABC-type uncharacterized transport system substrate-binding protein
VKFESPPCPASKFIERCGHFCGRHAKKVDVVIVPANGLFRTHRAQIAYLALAEHLPTITDQRPLVEAGGLAQLKIVLLANSVER